MINPSDTRRPIPWFLRSLAAALLVAFVALGAGPSLAAAIPAPADPNATEPAKVRQLLDLLGDPDVRDYLARAQRGASAGSPDDGADHAMAQSLGDHLDVLRNHLSALTMSVHDLPSQAVMAHEMAVGALEERGWLSTLLALAAFVGLGFGAQGLFHLAGSRWRRWLIALTLQTVDERIRAVFARLLYAVGLLASYAVGSIGAFLLFQWPSLIREILLGYLIAFLGTRLAAIVGRFLLAPGAERFRVVPVDTPTAWFFYVRLLVIVTVAMFGWQSIDVLRHFGLAPLAGELCTDVLALVLLALALELVWRRPRQLPRAPERAAAHAFRPRILSTSLSVVLILLWFLWVVQAWLLFWLLAFAVGVPSVIVTARASVGHILRPTGMEETADTRSMAAIIFERGARSIIIIAAALLLGWILNIDIVSLTMRDTLGTRIMRGLINVVVIGLAADFLWTLTRVLIDRKLKLPQPKGLGEVDAGHVARLQTLLPIVSNILLATIAIVAGMMMLAALGVQIGPLIASAGVVGVAIGFGAQTLVRDVISGIFYLVDDAFRIGEYIQSGNYKGTVESFSLRSVKLRHQRGALYTVPFGVLGAVQNQSRDWVVDKIVMNVPYGTDLEKVRKIIKKIGVALSEDPEFAPDIITPLKMQGVQQFGDYAIQIQTKMMTKPGDVQFMARRRALLMIKQAFEDNGINFASPLALLPGDPVLPGLPTRTAEGVS